MRPVVVRAVRELLSDLNEVGQEHDIGAYDDRIARLRPGFVAWPSDAQIGLHLLAWLRGPGFRHAPLDAALSGGASLVPDFGAASGIAMALSNGGHPGVIALHWRAAQTFHNARRVLQWNMREELVYYPQVLP